MSRQIENGDKMYLGNVGVTVYHEVSPVNTEAEHIYLEDENGNELCIPQSMEQLLSYTPYTIENGVLNGSTYEKPFNPKKGDLVLVWDKGDLFSSLAIFIQMKDGQYIASREIKISSNEFYSSLCWDFCKPFNPAELSLDYK